MIPHYFHLAMSVPDSSMFYSGHYEPLLVALSLAIAVFAAYTALMVSQHVTSRKTLAARRGWTVAGGISLGAGIWAMHFTGMLAFSLPCTTGYDLRLTLWSMIPGVLASILAVDVMSRAAISTPQLILGGVLLGGGIGAMHYAGMAAFQLQGLIRYDLKLFLLSIGVAVVLAIVALWFKFRLQSWLVRWHVSATLIAAGVMGLAISAMHYTAMAAAYFIRQGDASIPDSRLTPTFVAMIVLSVTMAIIVATLAAAVLAKPSLLSFRRLYLPVGMLLLVWGAVAWMGGSYYNAQQRQQVYTSGLAAGGKQLADTVDALTQMLRLLRNVPEVLARQDTIVRYLAYMGPEVAPSKMPLVQRKHLWEGDASLASLDAYLAFAVGKINIDVIWVINAAGDTVAASNAGTASSFVGSNFADRQYFEAARLGQAGKQYAVGRVSKIPGLFYSFPVLDKGRFIGAVVVKRDVTHFQRWIDPAGAFLVDPNGVVILATQKSLENRTLPDAAFALLPEEAKASQYRQSSFKTLPIESWKNSNWRDIVRLDGQASPVALLNTPVADAGISLYVPYPLPALMHIEAERPWVILQLFAAGAMFIVAAIAVVLYLRAMRQARLAAETANLAKSQFLATMSHEIRTPMNGVLGMAQLLLMNDISEDKRLQYTRTILNSGQTLLTLLNDILDFSKVEAGKIEIAQVAFDPHQVVQETAALFASSSHVKGLQIAANWRGPAEVRYISDPTRVRQMLSNLINNAVKFTAQGFVRIEATECERHGVEAVLEFAVTDSGIGIAPDKLHLLFQPFSQADSSTTRVYGGTGLGLSIVRSLAEHMGGDAGVASDAGKGARFWFRIKAKVQIDGVESRRIERISAPEPNAGTAQPAYVLVVEDNPVNRVVILALLGTLEVRVECLENGQEAVDAITHGKRPDLVLMDVQMPVLDGLAATEQIRQWELGQGQPRLPIIALTAGAFEEDRLRCLAAGMDDFLTKPISIDALKSAFAKWLPKQG